MANRNWHIQIAMNFRRMNFNVSLTSNEEGILGMLRNYYTMVDDRIEDLAGAQPGSLPVGFVGDLRVLLRCLVMNRLEQHAGKFVIIKRA